MFPIRDDIPSSRTPVLNYCVIGVTTAVFLYQVMLGEEMAAFVRQYGLVPAYLFGFEQPPTDTPRFLPLISFIFLHGGWFHLISNMWFLYIFGDNVEDRLGSLLYVVFYLACGLLAGLTQVLTQPTSTVPVVGASGAVSGVLGAYVVFFPTARVVTLMPVFFILTLVHVPAFLYIGMWFLMQLFSGTTALLTPQGAGIAWWAHIGGFLGGFWLAQRIAPPRPYRRRDIW